jgi:superfamily II DNA or RNA helicase
MSIISKKGYIINKKYINENLLVQVKKELTVKPKPNDDYGSDTTEFKVYREDDERICVPRFYGLKVFGTPIKPDLLPFKKTLVRFTQDLRQYQKDISKDICKGLEKEGGGLLCLPCGRGKTVIALHILCRFKLKTLIIVHKSFLLNQWYERIKTFTDATVGIIQGKKIDTDKDIVLGMVHSLSMKEYDKSIFKDFGMVIIDECHHIGSRVFSKSLSKCNSKYMLGLTATPNRCDGLAKVMHWYLGRILYMEEAKPNECVLVKSFRFNSFHKKFRETINYVTKKPNISRMSVNVSKIETRNAFIVNVIDAVRRQIGRKIFVLSAFIEHLDTLKLATDTLLKEQGLTVKTGYYIGKLKKKELEKAEENDILFGTFSMCREGLDLPSFNTLILTTSVRNVVQVTGRILRKEKILSGELMPLIIDINDNFSVYRAQASCRMKYFAKQQYNSESCDVADYDSKGKMISHDDVETIGKIFSEDDAERKEVDHLMKKIEKDEKPRYKDNEFDFDD